MIKCWEGKLVFIPSKGSSLSTLTCKLLRLEKCPFCGEIVRAWFMPPHGEKVSWRRYQGSSRQASGFRSVLVPGYQGLLRVKRCCQAELFTSLSLKKSFLALARLHFPQGWQELREFSPSQLDKALAELSRLTKESSWCGVLRGRDEITGNLTSLLAFDPEGDARETARELHAALIAPLSGQKRFRQLRTVGTKIPEVRPERLPSGQLRLF